MSVTECTEIIRLREELSQVREERDDLRAKMEVVGPSHYAKRTREWEKAIRERDFAMQFHVRFDSVKEGEVRCFVDWHGNTQPALYYGSTPLEALQNAMLATQTETR